MRRRSDSTSTAPDIRGSFYGGPGDENGEESQEEPTHIPWGDAVRDPSMGSANGSLSANTTADSSSGPVIPSVLLRGTSMVKVSKKKRSQVTFTLDKDAAKVSWDKQRPSKSFYIDDIKEIRTGADARNYREEFKVPVEDEPRFFSIVYSIPDKSGGRSHKVMHLIAADDQAFELWTTTLDAISKHRHELMVSLSSFNDRAVRACWRREMNRQFADKPHSVDEEAIDFVGVERLCQSLHIHGVYKHLRAKFDQADASGNGRLNFFEFQDFVRLMKRREDIRPVYREIAMASDRGITLPEFLVFLKDVQGEDVESDRAHWEMVFSKFVRRSKTKEQAQQNGDGEVPLMGEVALTSFLTSTFSLPVADLPSQISLDRPLHEYFISSSHNTYLLGRQVRGQSSVEAYISALSRGCRCVEIDCWNGSDGPVVMHGRTLTSQVSFADVMFTISRYAFVKTSFPLILSLEVHCNAKQQATMAQIIKDTCGSKLVTEPLDPTSSELPSPSQLLNRILVKVKAPREEEEAVPEPPTPGRRRGTSFGSQSGRPALDIPAGPITPLPQSPPATPPQRPARLIGKAQVRLNPTIESQDSLSSSTSESESINEETMRTTDELSKKKQNKIIRVLGELGVYCAGLKFHGFDTPDGKTYNHVFSFMEQTFTKNSRTPEAKRALVRHNMRYLMRVYPNGWRVASTNFDPLTYWRRGVQMAALNWQTYDLGMQLNEAMFSGGTDQTGYVLKPSGLREIKMLPNVREEAEASFLRKERKNVTFSIDVVSAQQLMRPKNLPPNRTLDPYIEVEVYHADDKTKNFKALVGEGGLDASGRDGTSGLGSPHRRRTQIIQENGFNPIFDKKFCFDLTTKHPDLVFVRWIVRTSRDGHSYDDKGPPLAVHTAKLSSLKQGYRTLPLMDSNGDQFLFSTLFCRIKIEPVTSIFVNSPDAAEVVGKLKSIGRSVFARTSISPKTSVDSGHQ